MLTLWPSNSLLRFKKKGGGRDNVYIKICKQIFITDVFVTEVHRKSIHSQTSKSSKYSQTGVANNSDTPWNTTQPQQRNRFLMLTRVADSQKPCIKWKKSGHQRLYTLPFHLCASPEWKETKSDRRRDGYLLGRGRGRSVARRKVLCDDCRDNYATCTHLPKLIKLCTYRWWILLYIKYPPKASFFKKSYNL